MSDAVARLNVALEGRYAIEREIGEGGMATVYLADDLRHERKVALKVLKPELAAVVGAERFLAEIKTTANLQHPHVLPLFDSGEADGFLFYVMPYVEGETLRERIDREKQLPVDEAVGIAASVASALQHAHDRGVIHRDIKPGNILLQDGQPVVSDFGIALAVGSAGGARLTETGLSVGTPYYMSPEQATGDQHVGPSSDTYALAAVLYEMLTGDPPYMGSTAQAVLGQIIAGEAVSATRKRRSIPHNVDAALRRALEKLPADRFTSAQDFAKALADRAFTHGEPAGTGVAGGRWGVVPVAATAAVLASVVTGAVVWGAASRSAEAPAAASRFAVDLPGDGVLRGNTAQTIEISRDGRAVVLNVASFESAGGSQLYIRRLDDLEAVPIRGTEGIGSFFLSPDGQSVAFNDLSDNTFKRVPATGGPPMTVAPTGVQSGGMRGMSWGDAGTIAFATAAYPGLMGVPDVGGAPEPLTAPTVESGEVHQEPHFLPGSELLLFTIFRPDRPAEVAALSVQTGEYRTLTNGAWPHYVEGGILVFQREAALWAARFDPDEIAMLGEAVPVLEGVAPGPRFFSVSSGGTVVYAPGSDGGGATQLVSVDRGGRESVLPMEAQDYWYPRLSPQGVRLAVSVLADDADLWVFDLERGSRSRLTFGGNNRFYPVWAPAGDQIAFSDGATGTNSMHLTAADGSGRTETLLEAEGLQYPTSWSGEGSVLAFHEDHPDTNRDLWVLPMGGEPEPFLVTPFEDRAAAFSPDGRWIAYVSDKSGRDEVYVRPYPGPGAEFTISTGGGDEPVWSRDGTELFYRSAEQMMVVGVELGEAFRAEPPRPLWRDTYLRDRGTAAATPNYDVMPDSESFVMVRGGSSGLNALVVVLDWASELERLLSAN